MRSSKVTRARFPLICSLAVIAFLAVLAVLASRNVVAAQPRQAGSTTAGDTMPRYDAGRNLVLPEDYRRWVLVGSSLGLSYSEPGQAGHQMFNTTLMEPPSVGR